MGTNRCIWDGIPEGLNGDLTTTGAQAISSLPNVSTEGLGALRHGDKTTACPACGQPGQIIGNIPFVNLHGKCAAGNNAIVICGCPSGSNRLISPAGPVGKSAPQSTRVVSQPQPVQHAQMAHRHHQPANQHEEPLPTTCACDRDISEAEFKLIATGEPDTATRRQYLDALNLWMPWNGITTCRAKAHFLAQVCDETGHFGLMVESGGASKPYSPYYGRGIMQLTRKANYKAYGDSIGIDLTDERLRKYELVETSPYNFLSGFWYYCIHTDCMNYAAKDDFIKVSAIINGGFNGYDERLKSLNKIIKILKAEHLAILEKNNSFSFESSDIYNNKVQSLLWGKWHDPNRQTCHGTAKNRDEALKGYNRALTLYTTHSPHSPLIQTINSAIRRL